LILTLLVISPVCNGLKQNQKHLHNATSVSFYVAGARLDIGRLLFSNLLQSKSIKKPLDQMQNIYAAQQFLKKIFSIM